MPPMLDDTAGIHDVDLIAIHHRLKAVGHEHDCALAPEAAQRVDQVPLVNGV
jgi:hypothetical protein